MPYSEYEKGGEIKTRCIGSNGETVIVPHMPSELTALKPPHLTEEFFRGAVEVGQG